MALKPKKIHFLVVFLIAYALGVMLPPSKFTGGKGKGKMS
jgi:hypothetical protein